MTTTPPNKHNIEPVDVTVSGYAAASLLELLEHCEEFLRTANPEVRTELNAFLAQQPTGLDIGWLIDMLGFNALYLQGKLAIAAPRKHTQTGDPS